MIRTRPANPECSCADNANGGRCHIDEIDGCVVVTVSGQIDAERLPAVLDAIDVAVAFARRIVIDLTRVTLLEPACLEPLNGALARARDSDGQVSLVGPVGVVEMALGTASADATLSVRDRADDVEVALDRTPGMGAGRPQ